jgi:predicted nucleic acid-binding protein
MAYLLDSNVFIQAKNLHYGFDFCPAFWTWLENANAASRTFSIEKVGTELLAGVDDLSDWANARGAGFFLPADNVVLPALARVSIWANAQQYEPVAVATFFQVADYWLVAHALAHGHTVVTHEVPSTSAKKIKIPNACVGLGIPCVSPFEMLRLERVRFVLGGLARRD